MPIIEGDEFYRCIGSSNQVITMGPLEEFVTPMRVEVVVWGFVVVNFALMALLWFLPFWLKLRRISVAAERFGRGDFATRARMAESSTLFPLPIFGCKAIYLRRTGNAKCWPNPVICQGRWTILSRMP